MCKVSDKLKLCTCSKKEGEYLQNSWTLYKFVEGKHEMIVGEAFFPFSLSWLLY